MLALSSRALSCSARSTPYCPCATAESTIIDGLSLNALWQSLEMPKSTRCSSSRTSPRQTARQISHPSLVGMGEFRMFRMLGTDLRYCKARAGAP